MESDFTKFVCAITFRNFMLVFAAGIHSGEILYKKEKINVKNQDTDKRSCFSSRQELRHDNDLLEKKRVWSRYGRKYLKNNDLERKRI